MAYTKTVWVNDETPVDAARLNNLEKGVEAAHEELDRLLQEIEDGMPSFGQLKPNFANSIEECVDTTKVYVLPDGYLYAYMESMENVPLITIEGAVGGYWYGDTWNPTGTFNENASCCAKRTGIIPVTPGDQLSYRGKAAASVDSVVWLDASKAYITDEKIDSTGEAVIVTAPQSAAYAWFGSFDYVSDVSRVVLEVRWVICQAATLAHRWTNTGHAFVPADYEDRIIALEDAVDALQDEKEQAGVADVLAGKKIVYDGDSICQGYSAAGGYPAMIAEITGGSFDNQAVGGGRLCANDERHSVVNNLANLPTDGDLYCFQGGINDWWGNTSVGTYSRGDYTGTVDPSTIYGAMETIFRYALSHFVGKPICFVITHKIQNSAYSENSNGNSFWDYREAMINVCEKYSVPYYDAFAHSGLNGWNEAQSEAFLTGNGAGTADGIHPNEEGYRRYYVPQLLKLMRGMMPVQ